MVDTHCHLNFKAFEEDVDSVIKSAFETGVTKIINVGTKLDSSQKAIELAEKYNGLYATAGIHPHHADKISFCHPERSEGSPYNSAGDSSVASLLQNDTFWKEFEKLARHPKVVAIGECGMDFYKYETNGITDPKLQEELFIKQIELASKLKLPLQIHNRQAGKEIINILTRHKSYLLDLPGVFHCFAGDMDFLKKVLDLGFYIGFDGNITYKGIAKGEITSLKDLVKATPLDRILTETDSPYLTPIPFRGARNMPEYVIIVGRAIAEIKNIKFEEVEEQTMKNAEKIFNLV